jgi:predicted ester cyclase
MAQTSKPAGQAVPGRVSMMQGDGAVLERNREVVRRFVNDFLNHSELSKLNEIMAPDAVLYHPLLDQPARGIEEVRKILAQFHTGFPDLRCSIDKLVADGDTVAVHLTCQGTQRGMFMNVQPTNRQLRWIAMNIFTLRDGKIIEQRACDDVMRQLQPR